MEHGHAHRLKPLSGVVTALVTPLTEAGDVDEAGLQRLLDRQLAAGVDAIFILGSVGEGPMLADGTADRMAELTAAHLAGRRPLLGGASDNSVERCLARLARLAARGIDYGVLTLPSYGWPFRARESVEFFRVIAARAPVPIVAYNLPKAVGWQMPVEVIEELFAVPNLAGLKDTHGDFNQMAAVAASPKRPSHFSYLPGNSMLAARLIRQGADGVVTTPGNVFPEAFVALWRHHLAGRAELVERIDCELIAPIGRLLDALPTGAAAIKAVLELRGICERHTVQTWPVAGALEMSRLAGLLREVDYFHQIASSALQG